MRPAELRRALRTAIGAARAAGGLLRRHFRSVKTVSFASQHDIKLELDERCQRLIERRLRAGLPEAGFLGEEGVSGDAEELRRWVVDPIDGTVNFTYGIPHACVSIALQERGREGEGGSSRTLLGDRTPAREAGYATLVGVVYDPFCDELWTAIQGQPARLNGRVINVSHRRRLEETVICFGFGKGPAALNVMRERLDRLAHRVRKLRITGAGALDLVYVASGRFDAFVESGVRLWDIAAGGLIVECAGGEFWRRPMPGAHVYEVIASNGLLRPLLEGARRRARGHPLRRGWGSR